MGLTRANGTPHTKRNQKPKTEAERFRRLVLTCACAFQRPGIPSAERFGSSPAEPGPEYTHRKTRNKLSQARTQPANE